MILENCFFLLCERVRERRRAEEEAR